MHTEPFGEGEGIQVLQPDTVMESIDMLEEFLVADIEANDYSAEYIKSHIDVCREQIATILGKDSPQMTSNFDQEW